MKRAAVVLVAAAAVVPYLASLGGDFVYDDDLLIVYNEHVHSLDRPGRFFTDPETLSFKGALHSYRPLRTLLFAVEWAVFGKRPWAFRIVSALLHAGVSLVLLAWLRRLGLSTRAATLGAALFAVHPAAVEAVAWISIQGDLVMAGAMLGALLLLENDADAPRAGRIVGAAGLFLLALGGKEAAVVLPALLVVRRWWRIGVGRGPSWASIATLGAMAAGYLVLRGALVGESAHRPWYGGSRWSTYGAVVLAMNYYAGTILFPVALTIRWAPPPTPPTGPAEWALLATGATLLVLLVKTAIAERTRRPLVAGALALFGLALLPASNLAFPLPTVSEIRYLYLPLAFVALAAAPMLARAPRLATLVLLPILALLAGRRAYEWRSPRALWTTALERPRSTLEALYAISMVSATEAREALLAGEVDPPALADTARYFVRYLRERSPIRMHPDERLDVGRLARDLRSWLRAAGRDAAAEEIRRLILDRWCRALFAAGLTAEAQKLAEAVRD